MFLERKKSGRECCGYFMRAAEAHPPANALVCVRTGASAVELVSFPCSRKKSTKILSGRFAPVNYHCSKRLSVFLKSVFSSGHLPLTSLLRHPGRGITIAFAPNALFGAEFQPANSSEGEPTP